MFDLGEVARRPSTSSESSMSSTGTTSSAIGSAYGIAHNVASSAFDSIDSIDWETTNMLLTLNHLSAKISESHCEMTIQSSTSLMEYILATQKAVDTLTHQTREYAKVSSIEGISAYPARCCILAGSIFVNMFLLRSEVGSGDFDWMLNIIKQDLEYAEAMRLDLGTLERMFWILYMAGCAAISQTKKTWFCAQVGIMRERLQLAGWNDAQEVLTKIAWVKVPGEMHGRSLWDESMTYFGPTTELFCRV